MELLANVVRLNIQLTKKCNQRCISCNSYELDSSDELSLEEFKNVIDDATRLYNIKNIAFTGGEPTLYRNILEIARYARSKSDKVSVTTNGFYCKDKESIRRLLEAGINRFSFSYHGVGIQDEFTGVKGSEARLINAIDLLRDLLDEFSAYVKVGTLYTGNNIDNVKRVLDFTSGRNIDLYIELLDTKIPIFKKSSLANEDNKTDLEMIKDGCNQIRKWKEEGYKILIDDKGIDFIEAWFSGAGIQGVCPLWDTDLYVESNGNVRSGCWSLPPIGNIRKKLLEDIICSKEYKDNIVKMKNRQCTGCTCGYLMQAKYASYTKR